MSGFKFNFVSWVFDFSLDVFCTIISLFQFMFVWFISTNILLTLSLGCLSEVLLPPQCKWTWCMSTKSASRKKTEHISIRSPWLKRKGRDQIKNCHLNTVIDHSSSYLNNWRGIPLGSTPQLLSCAHWISWSSVLQRSRIHAGVENISLTLISRSSRECNFQLFSLRMGHLSCLYWSFILFVLSAVVGSKPTRTWTQNSKTEKNKEVALVMSSFSS